MWILRNSKNAHSFYLTRAKSKYTIGRENTDLELKNDNSVSRLHCFLHLKENKTDGSYCIFLEDAKSTNGVFLNDGISSNTRKKTGKHQLKSGDRVRFGLYANIWSVSEIVIITVSSSMSPEQLEQLNKEIHILGGEVKKSWDEQCTHLTMSESDMTFKLLGALLDLKPVVNTAYWHDFLEVVQKNEYTLPEISKKYLPKNGDIKNADLSVQPLRQNIFKGMTFVFMDKDQFELYGPLIQKAGGTYKYLNEGVRKSLLIMKNVVVIQYMPSSQSQVSETVSGIAAYLSTRSRRLIPEFEIGLAIIYCSTEKFCNSNDKINNEKYLESQAMNSCALQNSLAIESVGNPPESQLLNKSCDVFVPETDEDLAKSLDDVEITDEYDLVESQKNLNLKDSSRKSISSLFKDFPKKSITNLKQSKEPTKRGSVSNSKNAKMTFISDSDDDFFQFDVEEAVSKKKPKVVPAILEDSDSENESLKKNTSTEENANKRKRKQNQIIIDSDDSSNSDDVPKTRAVAKRKCQQNMEINKTMETSKQKAEQVSATKRKDCNDEVTHFSKEPLEKTTTSVNTRKDLNSIFSMQQDEHQLVTSTQNESISINSSTFLGKKRVAHTPNYDNAATNKKKNINKNKRTNVSILFNDEDDDDGADNLFNFGDDSDIEEDISIHSHAKKRKHNQQVEDDNDDVFNFTNQGASTDNNNIKRACVNHESESNINREISVSALEPSSTKQRNQWPANPVTLKKDESTQKKWLTKTYKTVKIKKEETMQLNEMKVEYFDMNIEEIMKKHIQIQAEQNNNSEKSSGLIRSFKTFRKNRISHPQRTILDDSLFTDYVCCNRK